MHPLRSSSMSSDQVRAHITSGVHAIPRGRLQLARTGTWDRGIGRTGRAPGNQTPAAVHDAEQRHIHDLQAGRHELRHQSLAAKSTIQGRPQLAEQLMVPVSASFKN